MGVLDNIINTLNNVFKVIETLFILLVDILKLMIDNIDHIAKYSEIFIYLVPAIVLGYVLFRVFLTF